MKWTRLTIRIASCSLLVLVAGAASVSADPQRPSLQEAQIDSQDVLSKLGAGRGICVVLDDPQCELALILAQGSELTVYVQLQNAADRQAACRAADAAGLYGTRIYVGSGDPTRIHLADNMADALVAAADPANVPRTEVLRVLQPMCRPPPNRRTRPGSFRSTFCGCHHCLTLQ